MVASQMHAASHSVPPQDNHELPYHQPAPNNRMLLSLECGIPSEVTWALSRLLMFTATDRFHLTQWPTLPAALCHWPEWLLTQEEKMDEDSLNFCPSPDFATNRRFALDSILVLKNMSMTEEGGNVLARSERVRTLVMRILETCQRPTDSTLELLLGGIDLFRTTIAKWPTPPTPAQITLLIELVGRSHDRAVLISGWLGLHTLLDTFTQTMHVKPTSPALNAAIRVLPIHFDRDLISAALEYILAHVSHPALAKAFLHHPEMPQVLRLLASQLLYDQQRVIDHVKLTLGVPPKTAIAQNNAIGLLELTQEELDSISTLPEPDRVTKWMKRVFEISPHAEITQVDFWGLYKTAFAQYGPDSMLPATDLIKLVGTVFPSATPMVVPGVGGKPSKFVIKGLERKRAAAEGRTKCHWGKWGCPTPPFDSAASLFIHLKEHIAHYPTTTCTWGSCTHHSGTQKDFIAHLRTHLPLQLPVVRHPGQVDDVIIPAHSHADVGVPTARPVPPPPQLFMVYPKPREDPPPTSFAALLIMRILYRTSFVQAEVVLKTDGDHFGFPGIEQPLTGETGEGAEGVETEDFGLDMLEGQWRGQAAFKAIGGMLAIVQIHDPVIATWVDEMLDTIRALPLSEKFI
ncbi:Chromatin structure-remodeling complex protein rsc9 [Serendipita sp. 398]|nr:Chromatin structure-remodeling complex protein rsc9 [Serendipita sp. 398]